MPAREFFKGLDPQWQARFLTLYTRLGDTGRISNPEQFSKFGEDFWEFKAFRYRMPCYYREGKLVVITHGFIKKKEGRAPKQEEDRANSIKHEYEERLKVICPRMLTSIFYQLATIYAGLGEKDEAFRLLEKGYEERSAGMPYLAVDPFWYGMRSDPRYADLLRRMGLPQ